MPVDTSNLDRVILTHGCSKVVIYYFGASLTSWIYKDIERIFVSKKAIYDGPKAIRGGIPLVFPQFGPAALPGHAALPQHGFARVSKWEWLGIDTENSTELSVSFALKPNDIPDAQREIWNYDFKLIYTVTLNANTLKTKMTVINPGPVPFPFTNLLHTYIRVQDVQKVGVLGLTGTHLVDGINGNKRSQEPRHAVLIAGEVDRVYENVTSNLITIDNVNNKNSGNGIVIQKNNFKDVVVWNPWIENAKKMADFDDPEYLEMICVEVGNVASPVSLNPGCLWEGDQVLVAL
ncbi:putative glucose-6-phosphate 1-epimerase-like protein [Globomyces pollinis-pini]|nr:putative glucose-6-phosphate 1-epimerase-like protein [Globomyces pollinis-pini]